MNMTVEQAMNVYPLSEGKLIAGEAGKNRIVKAVNVMDAPDITDWVKEGEMLFTTAYLIKDRPSDAAQLLSKLNQCGSAALGIKLGRFWESVPSELIAIADDLGFPLIELPYQFTFSDQMNGLFREEMKRSTGALQLLLDKQVRLMRFALHFDHIRDLFEAVEEVVGDRMAVIGSRGQMLYNTSGIADEALLDKRPWSLSHQWMKHGGWQAFRVPLMRQSQCTGFVLFFNSGPFHTTIEESLYMQAAELIAFHMNVNYEDYFEMSVQRDFGLLVKRCIKNGLPVETLQEYAERWELDIFAQPYRCVLTDCGHVDNPVERAGRLEELKLDLLAHTRVQQLKGIHIVLDEGVLSLFPDTGTAGGERIGEALEACFAGKKPVREAGLRSVVSGRRKTAAGLLEAYEECLECRRLSVDWGIEERIVKYDTMDLGYVFERVPLERMQMFCERWLGGLLGKDPDYAQEMLRTLETYLECDGQLNETAKKLYIHRNTATYRIEKLGELLDVDFKRVNDLLRLKIAFMFRRILARERLSGCTR
ncbi:PucR family transcriptional regulator [Paenibacillus tarimensis]|uniref:PucR family transcriptional regulator n=1 Tax=Paenibacillus tarimensis TaxID=416012 RepID=UPI001F46EAEC|nr:PucR family transcriptional regulator [Paenibacillus tarimensis]MCF2944736.1 PucR family transcriptional regulator ligand-binding domain-containing protein [Paenibacillus tarimensis]